MTVTKKAPRKPTGTTRRCDGCMASKASTSFVPAGKHAHFPDGVFLCEECRS